MNIQNPSYEIWNQEPGLSGVYRQIERAGRVCYKSESNATADSAKPFVERMIKSQHTAMLEHGTVYLKGVELEKYAANKFSRAHNVDGCWYVTTNLRVLVENGWMDDLQLICEPTEHHERRVTVHFTTQVAITREFNRHRANSMAEQSTRYCNYSKEKFSGEISINLPEWVKLSEERRVKSEESNTNEELNTNEEPLDSSLFTLHSSLPLTSLASKVAEGTATEYENWLFANMAAEKAYMNLIALGRKPQEARVVLPLDTNTELVHTAFVSDWKHFFDLRALGTTGAPHPDAKILAEPLYEEFCRAAIYSGRKQ